MNDKKGQGILEFIIGIALIYLAFNWVYENIFLEKYNKYQQAHPTPTVTVPSLQILEIIDFDGSEQINRAPISVIVENCKGTSRWTEQYNGEQPLIYKLILNDKDFEINELQRIIALLTPALGSQYGIPIDKENMRSFKVGLTADVGAKVQYLIQWTEIWEVGKVKIDNGGQPLDVEYRVLTDLTHSISVQPLFCE